MIDVEKLSTDGEYWDAVAPSSATHYDPEFSCGPAWRRIEEDGRWFGEHPECGWYCFSPYDGLVERYISRPN